MSIREDLTDIKAEVNTLKDESLAMEILKDYKKSTKRLFTILTIVIVLWFITIGYLVYVLNDRVKETDTIEVEDVESIDNSHIKIGDDIWEKSK